MADNKPKRGDYPATGQGMHDWAQALRKWHRDTGTPLPDISKIWNNKGDGHTHPSEEKK